MRISCLLSMPNWVYFVSNSIPRWQTVVYFFPNWPLWLFEVGRIMYLCLIAPPALDEYMPRRPYDVATSAENQCVEIANSSYVIITASVHCNLSILLFLLVPNLQLCISRIIFVIGTTVKCKYHAHVHICTGFCSAVNIYGAYTLTFVWFKYLWGYVKMTLFRCTKYVVRGRMLDVEKSCKINMYENC